MRGGRLSSERREGVRKVLEGWFRVRGELGRITLGWLNESRRGYGLIVAE